MTPIAWFIIALIGFILELVQPGIYIICFAIGALVTGAFSGLLTSVAAQLFTFALLSCASVFIIRPLIYGKGKDKEITNVARMIGREGVVTIRIPRRMHGFVKLGSEIWMATADEEIEKGAKVKVLSVSGATVTVTRAEGPDAAGEESGKKEDME